jgi:prolyl-tRNA editing enzyme YbaK/EbsC (Cys-tRNA(Pro) deacylase)
MSSAVDRFTAAARARGLHPEVRRFPEGTKTADNAARAIGCEVAQIVKSLVFVSGDTPVLALVSGANRVDTAKLAAAAGQGPVRRASPEEARSATGFAVGGTPPFGHPEPVPTFVDPDLLTHGQIWAAAGTPESAFPLTPAQLVEASGGTVTDLAG